MTLMNDVADWVLRSGNAPFVLPSADTSDPGLTFGRFVRALDRERIVIAMWKRSGPSSWLWVLRRHTKKKVTRHRLSAMMTDAATEAKNAAFT